MCKAQVSSVPQLGKQSLPLIPSGIPSGQTITCPGPAALGGAGTPKALGEIEGQGTHPMGRGERCVRGNVDTYI